MARPPADLRRLAQERAWVVKEAGRQSRFRAPPPDFTPPLLTGGTRWIAGGSRREDQHGDDGR